jgi:hypothetical protein
MDEHSPGRLDALDQELDQRARQLDEKISRQFVWLVGAHVTTLVTIVAVLVAALVAR